MPSRLWRRRSLRMAIHRQPRFALLRKRVIHGNDRDFIKTSPLQRPAAPIRQFSLQLFIQVEQGCIDSIFEGVVFGLAFQPLQGRHGAGTEYVQIIEVKVLANFAILLAVADVVVGNAARHVDERAYVKHCQ